MAFRDRQVPKDTPVQGTRGGWGDRSPGAHQPTGRFRSVLSPSAHLSRGKAHAKLEGRLANCATRGVEKSIPFPPRGLNR